MAASSRVSDPLFMQVPHDLASRLSSVAVSSGRSPEAFLREAISRLIESTAESLVVFEDAPQHTEFVPQPQRFCVYE
jgi:predicted DNA-binding protein